MSEENKRITVDGHQQQMKKKVQKHIEKRISKRMKLLRGIEMATITLHSL